MISTGLFTSARLLSSREIRRHPPGAIRSPSPRTSAVHRNFRSTTAVLAETPKGEQQKKRAPSHVGVRPRFFLFFIFFVRVAKNRADVPWFWAAQPFVFTCIFCVAEIVILLLRYLLICHLDTRSAITIRAYAADFTRIASGDADGSSARGANPFRRALPPMGGNWTSEKRSG